MPYCYSQFTNLYQLQVSPPHHPLPFPHHFQTYREQALSLASSKAVSTYLPISSLEPRTGQGLPDVSHQFWDEWHHHFAQPARKTLPNTAQEAAGCLCCTGTLAASHSICPVWPPGLFLQSCFPVSQSPVCTSIWVYSSRGTGLCTSFCWASWGSSLLTSPVIQVPLGSCPTTYQTLFPALYRLQTCWGAYW